MTPATIQKREQLQQFLDLELIPHAAVRAVVCVGSVATGLARPNSDIDLLVFFDPMDRYIVPREFIWQPATRTFHSIFTETGDGLQFECIPFDLAVWSDPEHVWSDGQRAALHEPLILFDRTGQTTQLIAERTVYTDEIRLAHLDEAVNRFDNHLKWIDPAEKWASLGPAIAHDRLRDAYDALVKMLFACNHRWRPWSEREMTFLLALPWLPEQFEDRILTAAHPPSHDYNGYLARIEMLKSLHQDVLTQLVADSTYESDDTESVFIRVHDEPGRAWNMDAWNERHTTAYPIL
ncbi:MAG: nucleotidyltransferase domain-containing protein [Chloroflexota bacterium]